MYHQNQNLRSHGVHILTLLSNPNDIILKHVWFLELITISSMENNLLTETLLILNQWIILWYSTIVKIMSDLLFFQFMSLLSIIRFGLFLFIIVIIEWTQLITLRTQMKRFAIAFPVLWGFLLTSYQFVLVP